MCITNASSKARTAAIGAAIPNPYVISVSVAVFLSRLYISSQDKPELLDEDVNGGRISVTATTNAVGEIFNVGKHANVTGRGEVAGVRMKRRVVYSCARLH